MDFNTEPSALHDDAMDALPDAWGCEEEVGHFPMDLQSDEGGNLDTYNESSCPSMDTYMAADPFWISPSLEDYVNSEANALIPSSYSSNSQQTASSQYAASSWTSDQSSIPGGHFNKSFNSPSNGRPCPISSNPITHSDCADVQLASIHRSPRTGHNGQQYHDDTLGLSHAHDHCGSFAAPEMPMMSKRTSLITQALQTQSQLRPSRSGSRSTYRRQHSLGPIRQQTRSHPVHIVQSTTASLPPPSRAHQGMHMILEGWLKSTSARGGPRLAPQGKDLEALLTLTNATPASIHAWFVRRLSGYNDGSHVGHPPFSPSMAAYDFAGPSQATNNIDQQDLRDVEQVIRDRQARSCTTKHPYPLHTKPFSCGKCGAGAKDFTEWRRHRESVFPLKFFRCRVCNKIETRHVPDHTLKVHQMEPDIASYQIPYNPLWSGSCEYCGQGFQGLRTETWKLLQEHVWKQHIKDHPVTTTRCNVPVVTNTKDDDRNGDGPEDQAYHAPNDSHGPDSNKKPYTSGDRGNLYGTGQGPKSHAPAHDSGSQAGGWDDSGFSDASDTSDSSDDEGSSRGRTMRRRAVPLHTPLIDPYDGSCNLTADPDVSMWGIGSAEPVVSSDHYPLAYEVADIDIDTTTEYSPNHANKLQEYGLEHMFSGERSIGRTLGQVETEASPSPRLLLCRPMKHCASIGDLRPLEWHHQPDEAHADTSFSKRQGYSASEHSEGEDEVIFRPEHETGGGQMQSTCPVISPLQASFTEKQREYLANNRNFIVHLGKGVSFHHMPSDSVSKPQQITLTGEVLPPDTSIAMSTDQQSKHSVTAQRIC